ncbi:MAG: thioredoxin family protein, partial [Flavobacteriaceae bacterium]
KRPTAGRLAVGVLGVFFSVYLINGLVAQDNKLTLLSGFPPPTFYSLRAQESDCPLGLDCYKTYAEGKAAALAQSKPILLDFTGWACVNCRRMEEKVWALPDIYAVLHDDLVLTSLYVDDRAPLPENEQFNLQRASGRISLIKTVGQQWAAFQSINFNTASQPYYVLLHPNGTLLNAPIQYTDAATFKKWLEEGLQAYGELPAIKTPAWLQSQ